MSINIFEIIREDHDIHRKLLDKLVETSGATATRNRIYAQIKHELKIHADAEERYFYVPLFEADLTQDQARHGVAEHHEIDEIIEMLDKTEMDSPAWLVHAKQLREKVYHHLKDEEQQFFQTAGKVLNENQKINLAKEYQKSISAKREVDLIA